MPSLRPPIALLTTLLASILLAPPMPAEAKPIPKNAHVVFEETTVYHHIMVYDLQGWRTLSFDGSEESIMQFGNPIKSGFEYLHYFHAPFALNPKIQRVLMVGLGGASAAKQFQTFYPRVQIDIVELDPEVVRVAKTYFQFIPGPNTHLYTMDGRQYLKGTTATYDLILMDAYTSNPYGSFIPWQLATQEFFALAKSRLNPNGLLAYNVIGQLAGWRKTIMASVFRTMETSFPTIYMFPADTTRNVVMVGDFSGNRFTPEALKVRAQQLVAAGQAPMPGFIAAIGHVYQLESRPSAYLDSPILRDDYAPVDGLVEGDG